MFGRSGCLRKGLLRLRQPRNMHKLTHKRQCSIHKLRRCEIYGTDFKANSVGQFPSYRVVCYAEITVSALLRNIALIFGGVSGLITSEPIKR